MVQGLAFLSKKSWHTKNFANQEKVWMAEERKRAEEQKTKELAKQIQQEREQEELEEITGQKKKLDRGIDWMYQGSNPQSEIAKEDANKEQEEYLLGKEYVPAQAPKGDLDAEDTAEGYHAVMAQAETHVEGEEQDSKPAAAAAAPTEPTVHDRNEAFRMRHEDPMFAVTRKEREKQQKYENKKALYERVTGAVAVDVVQEKKSRDDQDERRARKRAKKEKRRRKRKRHREDYDSDRERDRHRRHHRRHRRSPSYDSRRSFSDDDHDDHDYYQRSSRRGRSRDRSSSYDRERQHSRIRSEEPRDIRRRNDSRSPGGRRSPSQDNDDSRRGGRGRHSYDRQRRRRSRSRSYDRTDRRRYEDSHNNRYNNRHENRVDPAPRQASRDDRKPPPRESKLLKREGYGLQGKSSSTRATNMEDLGPNKELLERKRREKEEERRRLHETSKSRRFRTPEEREAALRAMEQDAKRREDFRQQHSAGKSKEEEDAKKSRGDAGFLRDIRKATHGVQGDGRSMTERLQQNRHTNQKSNDTDFL